MILNTISGEKENEEEEDSKTESPALTGSLSALYGGVNPHLYSQFNLHIREQKINQITLLKVMTSYLYFILELDVLLGVSIPICVHKMFKL